MPRSTTWPRSAVYSAWTSCCRFSSCVGTAASSWATSARPSFCDNLRSLIMPAVSLGLVQSALIARITRSSMLDVLREQYILAGRAKGLSEPNVIYKHALRNAIIPTLTVIGISFAVILGGAVVVENVFNIPGLGRLIYSAVLRRDYPVIQGVVLLVAVKYTLVNLVVDLAYIAIDPRIRSR